MCLTAAQMGANAIILISGVFGPGGGITNVFSGDAEGVLLVSTAAWAEPACKASGP